MSSSVRAGFAVLGLTLLAVVASADPVDDSPQFRGPDRSGVFSSENLLKSWPRGGPDHLWSASGLGDGVSSVSVVDGRIYTAGMTNNRGSILAFDLAGKQLWKTEYVAIPLERGYPGVRTTPTYDDGAVYIMSALAKAAAFDAISGEILWQRDLPNNHVTWGIAESPLVVDDKAIFTPGGEAGTMVALDKKTGVEKWVMTELTEASAYCSPRLFDDGRRRQIITLTEAHMIGVDPATGKLLWKVAYPARYSIHAVSPVFAGGSIYVTDGYGQGGKLFDLVGDGRSVVLGWEDEELDVQHGGVVAVLGVIYGAASNGTWHALDIGSGETVNTIRRLGKGSVIYADGMLYGYTEKGEVVLVDPDPRRFDVVSRFEITEGEGHHWAHPVIAGGVLYIRHGDVLMAFDISAG